MRGLAGRRRSKERKKKREQATAAMGNSTNKEALLRDSPLTAKEQKALQKLITKIKKTKKSDELDREEFQLVLEKWLGKKITPDSGIDIGEVFASVDTDGSGTVNFKELVVWLSIYQKGSEEDKLRSIFRSFDLDGNGVLDTNEITNVLDILKFSLAERGESESRAIADAAAMVKKLDNDKDGKITLEEWVNIGKESNLSKELLGVHFEKLMSK